MSKIDNLRENLKNANNRLKEAIKEKATQMNKDATIQRFEFCFELSWKLLQAYSKEQGINCYGPRNCIRESHNLGIIKNTEKWFDFLNARNLTTHTYSQEIADKIYEKAKIFPSYVDNILENI